MLQSKEKELEILQNQSIDLDKDLKGAQQYNDNLRVQVENVEAQLKSVNRELVSKTKNVKTKAKEVSIFASKLHGLCSYVNDTNELKRRLVALFNEYDDKNKVHQAAIKSTKTLSLEERQSDLLKQKIKKKKDIMEKNKVLHQSRVRKLKRDQEMLEAVSPKFYLLFCSTTVRSTYQHFHYTAITSSST